jgi:hypothetical protein
MSSSSEKEGCFGETRNGCLRHLKFPEILVGVVRKAKKGCEKAKN